MAKYDTIVIGAGPAGISAAIYLKRYNLNPLVITSGNSSLMKATIENYYGIKSISGEDLLKTGIEQAKNLGVEVVEDEVTSIEAFVTHCKKASKNVVAFDYFDRSKAENALFGNSDNDYLHWDKVTLNILKDNESKYSKYSDYTSYISDYENDKKILIVLEMIQ